VAIAADEKVSRWSASRSKENLMRVSDLVTVDGYGEGRS